MSSLFEVYPQVEDYLINFKADLQIGQIRWSIIAIGLGNDGLPQDGEIEDCNDGFYRWIVHHHTLILEIVDSDIKGYKRTDILYIVDGEIRSNEEIERIIVSLKQSR